MIGVARSGRVIDWMGAVCEGMINSWRKVRGRSCDEQSKGQCEVQVVLQKRI